MAEKLDYPATATITIHAPASALWEALTNPEIIRQYFHGTTVVTDWQVGGPITWQGEWNGQTYQDKGTILDVQPNQRLAMTHWSPLSGTEDIPDNYHTVIYELTEHDDGTELRLTQTNNPTQEAADAMAQNGWMPILERLKAVVEQQ